MYAYICGLLLKSSCLPLEQFETQCLKSLLALSWDAVPNVRLALAKVLVEDVITNGNCFSCKFHILHASAR